MSTPPNKSYLAGISSFSPWGSRSTTPKPGQERDGEQATEVGLGRQRGGDHTVSRRPRLSLRSYPRDCPPLHVQWFHAVDIPKRKPLPSGSPPSSNQPPAPKKWVPFSEGDSRSLEIAYQKLADEDDVAERLRLHQSDPIPHSPHVHPQKKRSHRSSSPSRHELLAQPNGRMKVPVNEDYLFDVDIENRELAPAYWLGPVYEVRRGTWFYQESSGPRPCDENLATQLEEGYLKIKPWRFTHPQSQRSSSQPRSRPTSVNPRDDVPKISLSNPITPKGSTENLKAEHSSPAFGPKDQEDLRSPPPSPAKTHRLFGSYMNSVVHYQDKNTAWMVTDDLYSRMTGTVYQRFAGGAHLAGIKLVRGFLEPSKKDEAKDGTQAESAMPDSRRSDTNISGAVTLSGSPKQVVVSGLPPKGEDDDDPASPASENQRRKLERQMSSLIESTAPEDPARQEEEVRRRDEKEIQDDYKDHEGDDQGREIEHLLLVTHGIGQRLGLRMESVNFVHDVNTLRKTLKVVYSSSPDLQSLNCEVDKMPKNCRIQVLPIVWRHLLDFPKQSLKHNRKEHDLGDLEFDDDDYPNLDDITIDGVPAVRNLITDLALDVLLYQSPAYKSHISRIVLQECNRIYKLFKERNPSFKGKVSLVGHSLGSAIMFDILCRQRGDHSRRRRHQTRSDDRHLKLDFEVEDFYALGSPIGLFQMLRGRTIAARSMINSELTETPNEIMDDPFLASEPATPSKPAPSFDHIDITTSSPKCRRVFNIFHPTDPISYRLEPLISPAMSSLKPQPLPYTKKGIFTAPVGQGLTGIGARVGQSVSGLWSSFSSGFYTSLVNRSLGLSSEDAGKLGNPIPSEQSRAPLSVGSGTNISGGVIPLEPIASPQEIIDTGDIGKHPSTLIDTELETLYSGFQKQRRTLKSGEDLRGVGERPEWKQAGERSRKLRREEAKVRALNSNGRVDYSIQEGAFEINLIASIASHLCYYADEDVSHFMISQLLAQHRVVRKHTPQSSGDLGDPRI